MLINYFEDQNFTIGCGIIATVPGHITIRNRFYAIYFV